MKVLFAASEVAPIVKMGGLGDVIGALPKALSKLKIDVDVIIPFYSTIEVSKYKIYKHCELEVPFNGETIVTSIYKTKLPQSTVDVLLVRNDKLFDVKRGYIVDEVVPYAFFCKAVVHFINHGFNTYDIVHCHDWHTGMIPHMLTDDLSNSKPPVLFTIHNISYQGNTSSSILKDIDVNVSNHPAVYYDIQDGFLNFMQEALMSADYINTVSPSYASEILYKDIGGDLSSILYDRRSRLTGILNGLDYSILTRGFDLADWKKGKADAKIKLYDKLGLTLDTKLPLFAFVSRLDPNQKGTAILYESLNDIVAKFGAFVLLGTGDPHWEKKLLEFSEESNRLYGKRVSVNISFDIALAEELYQASDFLLIPSRFEPCGLTQMLAMYYGCLPIVRDTGGLKDSVTDSVNGFKFKTYSSSELTNTIKKAALLFNDKRKYDKMVQNALKTDFSWDRSAAEYKSLYKKVVASKS